MDEFDKIKELSDDIMGRKEPSFQESEGTDETNDLPSPFSGEELSPLELEDNKTIPMKWHLIALGFFVGILVIVLTGFFLFGDEQSSDKVVTITATPEPVRVKPEEAGGVAIPDQDKLIYNRTKATAVKVEKLFPEPEKPVLPEIMIKAAEKEPVVEQKKPVKVEVVIEEVPAEPKKEVLALTEKPAVKEVKKEPVVAAEKKTTTKTSEKQGNTEVWRIQLMSTQKRATAEKAWTDISKKHKALLSDMSHDIVEAEIAGKGTFYRVQAGRFGTREQAVALCTKLKAQKQECVPVKGK